MSIGNRFLTTVKRWTARQVSKDIHINQIGDLKFHTIQMPKYETANDWCTANDENWNTYIKLANELMETEKSISTEDLVSLHLLLI